MEYNVDVGKVESTGSDVRAEKNSGGRRGEGDEGGEGGRASRWGHLAVKGVDGERGEGGVLGEELGVMCKLVGWEKRIPGGSGYLVEVVDAGAGCEVVDKLARRILLDFLVQDADHHRELFISVTKDETILETRAPSKTEVSS